MTANAFMSVSLDPLLVAVGISRSANMHQILTVAPYPEFTVSILNRDQEFWSNRFAGRKTEFAVPPPFVTVRSGLVVLEDALAWFGCEVAQTIEAGDHVIVVGKVTAFDVSRADRLPLVFYSGRYYHRLMEEYECEWQILER